MQGNQNKNNIREILNSCISILDTIRIDYNSTIGPRTTRLMQKIKELIPLLECEHSYIASVLKQALKNLPSNGNYINAYVFGDIRTAIRILDDIYTLKTEDNASIIKGKKIFISHSSKDKDVVEKFVDHILMLGIGLSSEDIFCTSIEELAIKNGEDIRKHIHSNIRSADFSIVLISNNYKKSEICLNEMGAVWAYNNVRFYLLPNSDFDTIGWLCNTNQAEKLFNSVALDALKMELSTYYSLKDKGTAWSRQRETFLKGGLNDLKMLPVESLEKADYENVFLDPLLDCNVYELELLKILEDEPSASVLDITKSLNLSRSLLDKTIQSLINKGFLVREKIGHKTRWIVKA